jgi:flagellar basal body rod protein FlgG
MTVDLGAARAIEHVDARAADVQRAFTPGAQPRFDDVVKEKQLARFDVDPLSVAAPDGSYFVTRNARGTTMYTRDGGFALDGDAIVGSDGAAVLGNAAGGSALAPLRVDAVDAALGRVRNLRIEADGSVVYERLSIEPRSGQAVNERVVAGRVALARFPAGSRLAAVDANHAIAPHDVVPLLGLPGDSHFGLLEPMHREESNIDVDRSLVKLDDAYIELDAIVAAQRAEYSNGKTVMGLLK